ncbi:MAG: DNA-binding response regulator [Chloroflexi bacterium]|nr:MAG: DNA-binding response regulator [Phototrophicales bacterium]RMF78365.1 MAG: DNA-binding response regulator [Chloroflexota bacterium]
MTEEVIRIFIADDHRVVREGLRVLISTEPNMEIVGEAENGVDTVRMVRELNPDVILLDLVMEPMGGIEAIEQIKAENPDARILALTSFADDDVVFPAIKAGALGYLLKDSTPHELLQALHNVYQGIPSLAPSIALKLIHEINQPSSASSAPPEVLTEREVFVLKHVAQGLSNQEIASALNISERTVRNHVGSILGKLHLANRTQAALYALREGIINLEDTTKHLPPSD